MSQHSIITKLPRDLLLNVLSYYNPLEVFKLRIVSQRMCYDSFESVYLYYMHKYKRRFKVSPDSLLLRIVISKYLEELCSTDFNTASWMSICSNPKIPMNIKELFMRGLLNEVVSGNIPSFVTKWASLNCSLKSAVELLMDSRVDPSVFDNIMIRMACKYGKIHVVKHALLDIRTDPSCYNNYAFRIAACAGHLDILKLLLTDSRVDPTDLDNFAIGYAAMNGHIDTVKFLMNDYRVDPSDQDNYAIRFASLNGHDKVVQELLKDSRVNPGALNQSALRHASQLGHVKVVKVLLNDPRTDPSINNNACLKRAVKYGHLKVVNLLLSTDDYL